MGLLRRFAPRNDGLSNQAQLCRGLLRCFATRNDVGLSNDHKYPSFKFAQTIIIFARRALLPPINAPSLRAQRSNPLIACTPLFVPSLRGSNPLEASPSLINHHLPHILPKYLLRFFELFRCVLLHAFQLVFPSQRFVFVNA